MPEQTAGLGPKAPIRSSLYNGSTESDFHARGISLVQENFLWRKDRENNLTFDQLLTEHLERVHKSGSNSFTFLDIGSGDAGLFRDFLTNPASATMSRQFLASHPDFKIRMVGITDSPSADNHNSLAPFDVDDTNLDEENRRINQQVSADNHYWTLSRTQPLDSFLRQNGIDQVDLATATYSLMYLSGPVFKEVVLSVRGRLTPGGQFVATGYGGSEPGYTGISTARYAETEVSQRDRTPWKVLLRRNIEYLSTGDAIEETPPFKTTEEGKEALKKAVEKYKAMGDLTDDDLAELKLDLEGEMEYLRATPKQKIMARANRYLARGFTRHEEAYAKRMKREKFKFLESLGNDPGNTEVQIFGITVLHLGIPNNFIMTKSGGPNEQA